MNKKVVAAVLERADFQCELCGRGTLRGVVHHVVSGLGKRKIHECKQTCVYLCHRCHELAHGDARTRRFLQLRAQVLFFAQGLTEDEVRNLMGGRLYSMEEDNGE